MAEIELIKAVGDLVWRFAAIILFAQAAVILLLVLLHLSVDKIKRKLEGK